MLATEISSLRQTLVEQSDLNVPLFVTPDFSFSRRGLVNYVDQWRNSNEGSLLRGGRVHVDVSNDLSAAIAMIKLDGWCESMLLFPRDTKEEQRSKFAQSAAVTHSYKAPNSFSKLGEDHVPLALVKDKIQTSWIVPTSGTTGTPKLYCHNLAGLSQTVKRNVQKGQSLNWGLLYDPFRFAGIQVFLQALFGGSTLAIPNQRDELAESLEFFLEKQVNAMSATPTLWRKLVLLGTVGKLPLRQITLGGEIADETILRTLKHNFPTARIVHIYASTDAGVGFAVSDGRAGFPESFLSKGTPSGAQLMVDDEGQLLIRRTFARPKQITHGSDSTTEWISTGDIVENRNGRYYFLGRANGSINVGGNKVMPEEIENVIRGVTGVLEVKVEGRKNPIVGQVVQALVVPLSFDKNSLDALKQQVILTCRTNLDSFKVPGSIKMVEELGLTPAGKVKRQNES
jgi:acyl-CoA synthetase (AMP-forming)/AMP-acid ligase II